MWLGHTHYQATAIDAAIHDAITPGTAATVDPDRRTVLIFARKRLMVLAMMIRSTILNVSALPVCSGADASRAFYFYWFSRLSA